MAIALGKERTRNELLPYILDLMDDDEEILVQLATALDGNFLDYIGGPLYAPHLFKPLERLCEVEETVVRSKVSHVSLTLVQAVNSIKHILEMVQVKDLRQ